MTTNESLGDVLEEEMPIERLTAECGVCGFSMFDSKKTTGATPLIADNIIATHAEKHRNKTGHDDLQVEIDKRAATQNIDVTVTVNE